MFIAQLDAIFIALCVASSFEHVRNLGDIAATKSQVVYTRDLEVAIQNATKIVSSCATKIACVNGALDSTRAAIGQFSGPYSTVRPPKSKSLFLRALFQEKEI